MAAKKTKVRFDVVGKGKRAANKAELNDAASRVRLQLGSSGAWKDPARVAKAAGVPEALTGEFLCSIVARGQARCRLHGGAFEFQAVTLGKRRVHLQRRDSDEPANFCRTKRDIKPTDMTSDLEAVTCPSCLRRLARFPQAANLEIASRAA